MNNTDLKQISKLLDDRLDKKFDEKLAPIQKTLDQHGKTLAQHGKMLEEHGRILGSHDKRFDNIDKRLESHDTALESIGKTLKSNGQLLRSLKKDQNTMLGMLDEEQMKQKKRLNRIEDHLGFTPAA